MRNKPADRAYKCGSGFPVETLELLNEWQSGVASQGEWGDVERHAKHWEGKVNHWKTHQSKPELLYWPKVLNC